MTTYEIILRIHVVCGFTALVSGLIPMLTIKGSTIHTKSGWIYFWAMFGVFATSTAMFTFKNSLLFLFLIGVFSFYNTISGVRLLKYKKPNGVVSNFDFTVSSLVGIAGLTMIGLGVYSFFIGVTGTAILYTIFGIVCTENSSSDLKFLLKRKRNQDVKKSEWLFRHITRISGSYLATLTAFIITINIFPPLFAWLAPGIIGGMLISVVIKRIKANQVRVVDRV